MALADAGDDTPVLVDGDAARRYSARALRERILTDLRRAGSPDTRIVATGGPLVRPP